MKSIHRAGPLFTDLYELTMAAGYYKHQIVSTATFSLFIRDYPSNRNFFVATGLNDVLGELESFHFSPSDIDYLKTTQLFPPEFLSYLKTLRFSGDMYALPEGTIFFANEPIVEVTAPMIEAQILETLMLNTIGFSTMIASKAARCIHAANGRSLVDFSLRRTHEKDAGMKVARSTYIAGFNATSNVLAGKTYGIPISGTMAHSYISAFGSEFDAFSAYSDSFPENSIFLIDTYDTIQGAHHAVKVAKQMEQKGHSLTGVRLDSGDMVMLSKKVRKILDNAGLFGVKIFASSGFDEFKIADYISQGAKIDAFGVGTKVGVSADSPYLDIVYKVVRVKDRDTRKLSPGKITLAGKKQVFRRTGRQGLFLEDIIGLRDDSFKDGKPMLEKVMEKGKRIGTYPSIEEIRNGFKNEFVLLDDKYKSLHDKQTYPVKLSDRLIKLQKKL
ncbi:MAG: nicotinate phosphoribosyltransferase [Thermodesulfobacteriota bacterium]|nr:nicotinate phosphoribosyltransferase [Thermodesulfobacteriota bacterium]